MNKTSTIIMATMLFIYTIAIDARVLNVPDDYKTIKDGIAAAISSDTVLVAPGQYYEGIDFVGKKITVASNYLISGDTSIISKTVIRNPSFPPDSCYAIARSTIMFDSTENSESVFTGFMVLDESITISGHSMPKFQKIFVNVTMDASYSACGYYWVNVSTSENYILSGITLKNSILNFSGSNKHLIARGNVFYSSRVGQNLNNGMGIIDSNIFIYSSISMGSTGTYSDSMEISNNSFIDSRIGLGGTGEARHFAKITDNIFSRDTASYSGITCSGTGNNIVTIVVTGNTFQGPNIDIGGTGAYKVNATITRNIFTHALSSAVSFDPIALSTYSCEFTNNTVVGNKYGISVGDTVGSLNINNCIIWGNGTDLVKVHASQIQYSLWGTGLVYSQNGNITGDPMLVDTARHDLGLQKGSPCIDQGDPSQPADPDGTRSDIGAIPFNHSLVRINAKIPVGRRAISATFFRGELLLIRPSLRFDALSSFCIYDMKGAICYKKELKPGQLSINMKTIPLGPGSYVVQVMQGPSSITIAYYRQ